MSDFFEDWGNAIKKGYERAGEVFDIALDQAKDGNVMGALSNTFTGIAGTIGNTITLGGASALGESLRETYEDAQAGKLDENGDKVELNVAEKILTKMAESDAQSVILQNELAEQGELAKANGLGAIDLGFKVTDVVGGIGLTHAVKDVGKNVVKNVTKTAVREATEEAVEQTAKTAVKEAAKETAEQVTKTAVKETAEEVAEEGTKRGIKQVIKDAAKTAKNVKDTAVKTGKDLTKDLASLTWKGTKRLSLAQGDAYQVNRIAENVNKYGIGGTILKETQHQGANISGDAVTAVGDIAESAGLPDLGLMSCIAEKWPKLAAYINSARAAAFATSNVLVQSTPGAYAAAVVNSAKEKVSSWLGDRKSKYEGKTFGEIATQLKENSAEFSDSWSGLYKRRVLALDEKLGLDSSNRKFMMGDSEPSEEPDQFEPVMC